jgi:predicted nucleic acid-binding protein
MSYLCDTNIISELARPKPNIGIVAWSESVTTITLSTITIEEIAFGLIAKPNPRIQAWFQNFLRTYCQVLPVTSEIAQLAGELRGGFRNKGITRSQADMLISATAKVHNLTLVTRNTRDFEDCGVSLLNPFRE